jgi:hypothetical protein
LIKILQVFIRTAHFHCWLIHGIIFDLPVKSIYELFHQFVMIKFSLAELGVLKRIVNARTRYARILVRRSCIRVRVGIFLCSESRHSYVTALLIFVIFV